MFEAKKLLGQMFEAGDPAHDGAKFRTRADGRVRQAGVNSAGN